MVDDDMVTHFDFLGKVRVLNATPVFTSQHLPLAVEVELLTCFNGNRVHLSFELTESDPRSLQVNVDSTLLALDFSRFAHHIDQNFMLFILDLSRVDPAYVHAFLQHLDYGGLKILQVIHKVKWHLQSCWFGDRASR